MIKSGQADDKIVLLAGSDEHQFITAFFNLFRTARLYDPNNNVYLNQSSRFYDIFRRLADRTGEVPVKIIEGRVLVGDRLVRFDNDGLIGATYVIDSWRLLGIGGVILGKNLDNRQLDKFIYLVAKANIRESNNEIVAQRLVELGISGVTLLGLEKREDAQPFLPEDKKRQLRQAARMTFFRSISTVEDILAKARESREIDVAKARRVVHTLIDQLAEDESYLLQLTALRDFDEYTYVHSTNICVYSLTMGIRLGLDRQRLAQLGFSALFHDLGKIRLPGDLIRKPEVFDEHDWIQMQRHPELGVKTIFRNMELNEFAARAAIVAYQHHINEDFTGYPSLRHKRPLNLFSKIIAIADTFDAMASGRVYMKRPIPHDEILRKMMYQMSVKFDAFLLKLFVNIVGMYPPGSLVLLTSNELALVSQTNYRNPQKPKVRIIGNESGPFQKFIDIDLADPDNAHRRIDKIVDPHKYNIDTRAIILIDD